MSTGNAGRRLAIAASVVVIAAVATAMLVMGSPGSQRESRLDRKREQDMGRIAQAIDLRTVAGKPLPADLAGLAGEPGRRLSITDPATGAPYAYETTGGNGYRLCAVFATDTAEESRAGWIDQDWLHGKGRHCFDRTADRKKD
jgi:type II secretory pathway pseudopilin PulG